MPPAASSVPCATPAAETGEDKAWSSCPKAPSRRAAEDTAAADRDIVAEATLTTVMVDVSIQTSVGVYCSEVERNTLGSVESEANVPVTVAACRTSWCDVFT